MNKKRLSTEEITPGIYYWEIGTSIFITHIISVDTQSRMITHEIPNMVPKWKRTWLYGDRERIWPVPTRLARKLKLEQL